MGTLVKVKRYIALSLALLGVHGQVLGSSHGGRRTRLSPGEHVAKIDNLSVHYTIRGKGPLVVVQAPGWGIGTEYLAKGLSPLTKRFSVLTYDPRGTGLSSRVSATDHLTNADLANDLEHLRAYLGLPQFNLLAHSNGSAIAILYAEQHPARVGKLVLIGSQLLGYSEPAGPTELDEDLRRKSDPQFATFAARMRVASSENDARFTSDFKGYAGYFFYNPEKDAQSLLRSITKPMSAAMNKAFRESPPAAEAPPLTDLAKITANTLIIEGRQDPACPLRESERIAAGIAGSSLVQIDHSGHFPWIEQPSEFFESAVEFLSSPGGSGGDTSQAEVLHAS